MSACLRQGAPHLLIPALVVVLGACGTPRAPVDARGEAPVPAATRPAPAQENKPVEQVPAVHTVARGDTLYSISWRYGLDYRDIARWNGIADPYVIHPGRRLRLMAPVTAAAPAATAPAPRSANAPMAAEPVSRPEVTRAVPSSPRTPVSSMGPIRWQWPARGRIVRSNSPTSKKGVDISGSRDQPINAAAPGAVVYSGSGLLGYGRLIILKHSDTFLSAYAYNEQLLVAEGDRVSGGQQIATMGTGTSGQPMLHFEIRKDGKPVNPLEYLPRGD